MSQCNKAVSLQNHVRVQMLVILMISFVLSTNCQAKGPYRYNPLGSEIRYLPNTAPYLGDMALNWNEQVKCKTIYLYMII